MNKLISLLLALVMAVCMPINAFAAAENKEPVVSPNYLYTFSLKTFLSIIDNTAECMSDVNGRPEAATKVVIVQRLQKKNGNSWSTKATWIKTFNTWHGTFVNTKKSLASGTYRVETEAIVYSGEKQETVYAYSVEVTI